MNIDTFRICHISDLHLSSVCPGWVNAISNRSSDTSVARAALVNASNFLRDKFKGEGPLEMLYPSTYVPLAAQTLPRFLHDLDGDDTEYHLDLVLITGDLSTTGEDADLLFASDFLEGKVLAVADAPGLSLTALTKESFPFFPIPGNHDRYRGILRKPKAKHFEDFFGPCWDINQDKVRIVGDRTRRMIIEGKTSNLAIIGVDFSLDSYKEGKGLCGYLGKGKVYRDRLISLKHATEELKDRKKPHAIVWAMHFPPEYPNIDPDLQLLDSSEVINMASEVGVKLILAGHAHQKKYWKIQNSDVFVMAAGSTTGTERIGPNVLHDLQIPVNNGDIVFDEISVRDAVFNQENRAWELKPWESL